MDDPWKIQKLDVLYYSLEFGEIGSFDYGEQGPMIN